MRFLIVLVTIFSACCCFSVSNFFSFYTTGLKSYQLYQAKSTFLKNSLTGAEILRCQNFTDKVVKDLIYIPTQEELQDILSQCRLLLQQDSKLFASKDENDSVQSPPFKKHRRQEHDFIIEELSTKEIYEVNNKNTGGNETSNSTSERRKNDGKSTNGILSGKYVDLKEISTGRIFRQATRSPSLWSLLLGSQGSFSNSTSVPVAEPNESSSTEKPIDKPENRKMEFNTVILNSTNTIWSLWNYLSGLSGSSNSSNENLERDPSIESASQYSTTEITAKWKIVMPGTKWCGPGDTAVNDDDLGYFEDVDKCCRAHDKCNDLMVPGESKYNLKNTSPFTVLNCKCDDELYDCLREINSIASNAVGNAFFNLLSRMCYTLDYPRICTKRTLSGCLEYTIDKTAEKVYQWKPAKKYLKMPFTISR